MFVSLLTEILKVFSNFKLADIENANSLVFEINKINEKR